MRKGLLCSIVVICLFLILGCMIIVADKSENPVEIESSSEPAYIQLEVETTPTPSPTPKPTPTPIEEPIVEEVVEEVVENIYLGNFILTAYCSCELCCGEYAYNRPVDEYGNQIVYGASGTILTAGVSIAVDPSVIPYGSEVVFNDNVWVAQDTGGGIVGNHIDVYFDNHEEACNFGLQYADVYLVGG